MRISKLRGLSAAARTTAAMLLCLRLIGPAYADAGPATDKPAACGGHDISTDVARNAKALAQAKEQRRDELLNAQGLLWRVEKPGLTPSYLYGTIHSSDDGAVALARSAGAHIKGASVVATELGGPMDKAATVEMGAAMMAKALALGEDTLAKIGRPEDVAIVEKYLTNRGLTGDFAHHLRPWFLAAFASAPLCELERQRREIPVVDEVIARTGKELGVKVVGLETFAEQTDVLSSIDPDLATVILLDAARRPELGDDVYATLVSLYRQQKPGEILPVIDASGLLTAEQIKAQDEFVNHLLGGRNKIMVERMKPLLATGGAFVAVGAFHLVGKGGLIELLRGEGFNVTPAQ